MPRYKANVICYFDVVVEDDDIESAQENIELSKVEDLFENKISESIEFINVTTISQL